jgi:hypothetical protein
MQSTLHHHTFHQSGHQWWHCQAGHNLPGCVITQAPTQGSIHQLPKKVSADGASAKAIDFVGLCTAIEQQRVMTGTVYQVA